MRDAECVVVTGPPGAGKSTVAALVAQGFETAALVPGDAFFAFWAQGAIQPWLPEANDQNTVILRAAGAAVGAYVAGGCQVVYDGVLGPWFLPEFTTATGLAQFHYVVLLPTVEQCVERVASRSGHGFRSEAATRQMHADFSRARIDARHVLRSPSQDPTAVADDILQLVAEGQLVYRP